MLAILIGIRMRSNTLTDMDGPCIHCTDPSAYEVIQDPGQGVLFCRCPACNRTYVLAELNLDGMCIESIEQLIWKELDRLPESGDILGFVLENKPYFASSRGGAFYPVEKR
tara:strand:+ start:75422 stop:75754 length:333 start_codon:yes stop_codon:yes gene_type:complete